MTDGLEEPKGETNPQREMLLLGEALDLVTSRQGFKSPALVPLVTALITRVRVLRSSAPDGDGETAEPARSAAENGPSKPAPAVESEPEADPGTERKTVDANHGTGGTKAAASPHQGLEEQLATRDKKLASLTLAVGQLVNVLQRRSWSGGIDRRDALRVSGQDARVFINDRPYDVINWSTKGFLIKVRDANRIGMRDFEFHFMLELPDETIEFQGRAKTVRIEGDALAAQFEKLDDATNEKIAKIMASLRGPAE